MRPRALPAPVSRRAPPSPSALQNAAGGAARRPPGPARRRDRARRRVPLPPKVPRPLRPPRPTTQRHIRLRIGPRQRPHNGRIPIDPPVPPQRPASGPGDRARQAKIIRPDKPPCQGTVIHNPSPTGACSIRRPGPTQASISPARRPPAAKRVDSGGQDPAGPPSRAVLGIRGPSRRAVIARAGRAGGGRDGRGAIASRVRHRYWPSCVLYAVATAVPALSGRQFGMGSNLMP